MTYTIEEIVSYLLGAMPEAEAESLELAYFTNSALAGTVTEIENNLIDDYVRGHLPSSQRKRFEQYYLSHPNRYRRVEAAKVLLFRLDQLKKAHLTTAKKGSQWWQLPEFIHGRALTYAGAALALLLALGGFRLRSQNSQLRQQITAMQIAQSDNAQRIRDLSQQVTAKGQIKDRPADEVEQLHPRPFSSPAHSKALSNIPALTLTIGAMRGERREGKSTETFSQPQMISSGNKKVRLIVKMRETDYRTYLAEIWNEAGESEKIFSTPNQIKPNRHAGVETVEVLVSTSVFKKGISSYRIQLTGIAPSGQEQPLRPALFQIEKR